MPWAGGMVCGARVHPRSWLALLDGGAILRLNDANETAAVQHNAAGLDAEAEAEAEAQREALGIVSRDKALYAHGFR